MGNTNAAVSAIDTMLDQLSGCLDVETARRVVDLKINDEIQTRVALLGEKANEGAISTEELDEYKSYVEIADIIAILKLKAPSPLVGGKQWIRQPVRLSVSEPGNIANIACYARSMPSFPTTLNTSSPSSMAGVTTPRTSPCLVPVAMRSRDQIWAASTRTLVSLFHSSTLAAMTGQNISRSTCSGSSV